ncbi:uncharacterized protein H6S33_012630 [Morchella sextelata]|uniref:uncharacterized protein n=1 Tax=Morchella sextelata TaxID=1174677 RepID=UPI001D052A8E|nr:uncharacterized protein H6S33_012630 [Morchella sextelata]KAH0610084.1 hypothetical protein H6S33_012630 [Morchella sextelata]
MEYDTKTTPYKTSDKSSFAYVSTQAIDDVFRHTMASKDPEHTKEGKTIVEQLAKMKYEMQHDRVVTPLEDDGEEDIKDYNKELEQLGNPKWFEAPWLFIECYFYRRIQVSMNLTKTWKSHDVFHLQKNDTFKSSLAAVLELASKYRRIVEGPSAAEELTPEQVAEKEKLLFIEMAEICLWGNATDLSLLTSLSYEDIQKLQGSEARKNSEKNILVNDLSDVYEMLLKQKNEGKKERRVDIVLDNSGFELFVDLILGGYLLYAGLATEIVFHPKSLPWFVSDVLPKDFADLLNALHDPVAYFSSSEEPENNKEKKVESLSDSQKSDLESLFSHWSKFHADGKFVLRPNRFWTAGGSYWRLPKTAPELFEDLQKSELVIFKGDLNYRKLTGDADWNPTTKFEEAIGPLGEVGSGIRVLALRTCKADVVVGLPEGKDEELRAGDAAGEGRKWAWSGKWAVVEFWDGKA